jgi:signal transduction histidine kinase
MWKVGAAANLAVALVYLAIAVAIVRPLVRERQLRANRLGTATAAIFLTCAVHHGSHAVHVLLPYVGLEVHEGLALRAAFNWHVVGWDVLTAAVGIYYWTLRRTYGPLMRGAKLFEDMKERQRQALEINDTIVQGLFVAQTALALGERETSEEALHTTLESARHIISDLLGEVGSELAPRPGQLVRDAPALIGREPTA